LITFIILITFIDFTRVVRFPASLLIARVVRFPASLLIARAGRFPANCACGTLSCYPQKSVNYYFN
jgi:hypothetical protein